MGQAIITRYHGPTETRGARISATAWGGRISIAYSHDLDSLGNHAAAADALASKLQWHGLWVAGGTPDERGYAFVATDGGKGFRLGSAT